MKIRPHTIHLQIILLSTCRRELPVEGEANPSKPIEPSIDDLPHPPSAQGFIVFSSAAPNSPPVSLLLYIALGTITRFEYTPSRCHSNSDLWFLCSKTVWQPIVGVALDHFTAALIRSDRATIREFPHAHPGRSTSKRVSRCPVRNSGDLCEVFRVMEPNGGVVVYLGFNFAGLRVSTIELMLLSIATG